MKEGIKVLTEAEIQERLYGRYRSGLNQKAVRSPTHSSGSKNCEVSQPKEKEADTLAWTGAEILAGELKALREELLNLRREREQLAAELQRRTYLTAAPSGVVTSALPAVSSQAPMAVGLASDHKEDGHPVPASPSESPGWLFLATSVLVVIAVGVVGYPLGARLLQASPSISSEPTPYTVQVAIYHAKPQADAAIERLRSLGFPAFLAKVPRRNGRMEYRVYLGQFVTKEEATQERQRLERDPRVRAYSDAFVRIW